MNKFEQLIEFVINDEEQKARDLFHEIVVEKSRSIYESLMAEEEELDEAAEEELDEEAEEELDEGLEEMGGCEVGGDQADDLIDDIETEEEGLSFEGEEDLEAEFADEEEGEDLEDRVVDLEDKLDELMSEFEALLGGEEEFGDEEGAEEFGDEEGAEEFGGEEDEDNAEFEVAESLDEAVTLQKVPAPKTSEESFVNKKSINDDNSGQAGMEAKPVKTAGGEENGRTAPKAGELIGKVQNSVGGDKKLSPATKPTLSQASGVNTKTPFPKN